MHEPARAIDIGNSGTTIRLLLGILAGSPVTATLTGDESIRRRPMGRVVEPLRRMGADIDGVDGGRYAPLSVRGRPLHGAKHELPVASAQVKSALLLAGISAGGETSVTEPARSRDHTERMLRYLGAPVTVSGNRSIIKSTKLQGARFVVPGDISSAAFLLVAAAILDGSSVRVAGVGVNPTRAGILEVLAGFGAELTISDEHEVCGEPVATVTVRPGDRRPLTVSGDLTVRCLDELPLVAVLGALAEGETVVADAAELRVKESDRIAAIEAALGAMGADIRSTPDGFVVRGPARLRGAAVESMGDHRIAMAGAVAALAADGPTRIEGWDSVPVSYPGFERDLDRLVVR